MWQSHTRAVRLMTGCPLNGRIKLIDWNRKTQQWALLNGLFCKAAIIEADKLNGQPDSPHQPRILKIKLSNEFFRSDGPILLDGCLDLLINGSDMERTKPATETISPFAVDPFVAQPSGEVVAGGRSKKSVREILDSIKGYQTSAPVGVGGRSSLKDQPMLSSNSPRKHTATSVSNAPANADWNELISEDHQPEFDVHLFAEEAEPVSELPIPEPIRSGFEVDQDYFDYAAIEQRIDAAAKFEADGPAVIQPTNVKLREVSSDIFWAQPDQVIYIDGMDGYGFIDLACFDLAAASFEANQIRVQLSDSSHFRIDYRNVTHAVFAQGVEIELSANEEDFDSEMPMIVDPF